MTNHPYQWPSTFTRSDRRRFNSLVRKAAASHRLHLNGEIPDLKTDDGGELSLRNLIAECALMPSHDWAERIRWWIGIIRSSRDAMDDLGTMSRDVAEASLRIRLLPDGPKAAWGLNRPSMPGLVAALFMQRVGFSHNVKTEMLDQWGFGVEEAFEVARRNSIEREQFTTIDDGRYTVTEGDSNFVSSRVLLLGDEDTRKLSTGSDNGEPVPIIVSVPTRHCFIAAALAPDGWPFGGLVMETMRRYENGPGSTLARVWFADLSNFGEWGEGAEPIDIQVGEMDGEIEIAVAKGPRLTAFLGAEDRAA
jgi:hypothetical protein